MGCIIVTIHPLTLDPLRDCQGQPYTTEELEYFLTKAEEQEEYELCAIYRDEISRRKKEAENE